MWYALRVNVHVCWGARFASGLKDSSNLNRVATLAPARTVLRVFVSEMMSLMRRTKYQQLLLYQVNPSYPRDRCGRNEE